MITKYIDWDEFWQPTLRDEQLTDNNGTNYYVPVEISEIWYEKYLRVKKELDEILDDLEKWETNGQD